MKKQFLNLGKALSKAEQKQILAGVHELTAAGCSSLEGLYCDCPEGSYGNASGCGCVDASWCVSGKCSASGMFGMCL